jgi:hypothetical protein
MTFISYEEFGINFVSLAVTPERVEEAVAKTAGDGFRIGPIAAGPGGIAVVSADGTIAEVRVDRIDGPMLRYQATLGIDLNLEVRLAGVPHRYRGEIEVPLSLVVQTADPLSLVIEVRPVSAADVSVDLRSAGISASVLQRVGNMQEEVRKQVVDTVNRRVSSEDARRSRHFDIASMLAKPLPTD